jgi:hypothetical protein
MKKLATVFFCFSFLSLSACSLWDSKAFYATHPTRAEEVTQHWGDPVRIEVLENGTEKWIYSLSGTWFDVKYYFLIREGKVMDFGAQ